jgi:hypothetical protein
MASVIVELSAAWMRKKAGLEATRIVCGLKTARVSGDAMARGANIVMVCYEVQGEIGIEVGLQTWGWSQLEEQLASFCLTWRLTRYVTPSPEARSCTVPSSRLFALSNCARNMWHSVLADDCLLHDWVGSIFLTPCVKGTAPFDGGRWSSARGAT